MRVNTEAHSVTPDRTDQDVDVASLPDEEDRARKQKEAEKGCINETEVVRHDGPNLVTWDGENDLANPKNWRLKAKWTVTLLMSGYSLVTLTSSSMIAPALPAIARDMNILSNVEVQVIFSSFILAAAVGPFLFSPLSEIYGRRNVTQIGNLFYIVWTVVCGFANNKNIMIIGRFMSGLGASVTFGVQYGLLSDCWKADERGKSLAILNFAPLLGPSIGPIIGGFIALRTTWRWIFWSIAIFDGMLQLLAFFFLWETHAPILLARKARRLCVETGNMQLHTSFDASAQSPRKILQRSLMRPLRILTLHPTTQLLTLYGCVAFGTLYVVLSDFAEQWIDRYKETTSSAGLHYLALVIGFTSGCFAAARMMDRMWQRAKSPSPELRIFLLIPGAILLVAGLLLYGWSAQELVHWIVPDIGVCVFAFGTQLGTTAVGAYLTDVYGQYTASASGGSFAMRSLCAFGFPLFAPQLYLRLGYGWGNTLLAGVCALVGVIVPTIIYKNGPSWRVKATSSL